MGIEYKIRFAVPSNYDPGPLFRRLPSPIDRRAMNEIYNYSVQGDGFYFVDRLVNRDVAAVALRSFIDEALSVAHSVEMSRRESPRPCMDDEGADRPTPSVDDGQLAGG